MGFELERAVNAHFGPFYPYVAEELIAESGLSAGLVLEIGPYGPGISIALARMCPEMDFVCGDEGEEAIAYLAERAAEEGLAERIGVQRLDKYDLPFEAEAFDLVVFRGGLFFWERQERILAEMDRVLAPGGMGALGGGFGAGAPDALIESLLPRARELNDRLGKRRLSVEEAEDIAAKAGLSGRARLARRHGLWLFWGKGS